jgi:uncharacterized oligopeptide transporter (OPT) family protein
MKKFISASAILLYSSATFAQDTIDPFKDRQFLFDCLNITGIVIVIYLISNWILQMMKQNLDFRIKSKIIEKETSENVVSQLVQPNMKDAGNKKTILQWAFVLAGIGAGFAIISFTRPFGLHSLSIMAFCLAGGFAAYYYSFNKS